MITIERVLISHENICKRLPSALDRIGKFCTEHTTEANPSIMVGSVALDCMSNNPHFLLLVAVNTDSDTVVGHLLASIDSYYGSRICSIMQLSVDRGSGVTQEIFNNGMKMVDDWADYFACSSIRILARNAATARLFKKYGFSDTGRVQMSLNRTFGGTNGWR